jgi:ribosomal protein S18 acetylase RimI-like enzyme
VLRAGGWEIRPEMRMWRMVLDPARFVVGETTAERLGPGGYERLQELYRDGDATGEAPPFFNPGMLQHGIYYGVRNGEAIVAAAGTLVFSPAESVAAIGAVYTLRSYRGRGLARQVTAAVTAELLNLGVRLIALNVVESNSAAIRVYERLGFRSYCEYREGRARYGFTPVATR